MITHRLREDTQIDFDWTDSEDTQITVSAATFTIDGEDTSDLLSINGDYAVTLDIPHDYSINAGIYHYELIGDDGTTKTILSAGLLRVKG